LHRALAAGLAEASSEQPDAGNQTPNGASHEPVRTPEEVGTQLNEQPSPPRSLRPSYHIDPSTGPDASPSPLSADVLDWPSVPGYEIQGVLGEGGMGIVYQAKDPTLQRVVALKMIKKGLADEVYEARFYREA